DRARRFEHEVDRTKLQRAQRGRLAAARRPGAQHDDGPRRGPTDALQRAAAVELRHVDVERDDVRIERLDLPQAVVTVPRGAGDLELARLLDDLRDHAPHERAVVY